MKKRFSSVGCPISVLSAMLAFAIVLILTRELFAQTGGSMRCGGLGGGNNSQCPTGNCIDQPGGSCSGAAGGYKVCEATSFWGTCGNTGTHTCPGKSSRSVCGDPNPAPYVLAAICDTSVAECP